MLGSKYFSVNQWTWFILSQTINIERSLENVCGRLGIFYFSLRLSIKIVKISNDIKKRSVHSLFVLEFVRQNENCIKY